MSIELEQCEQKAKQLSLRERALLIKRLIQGLDELDEQEIEQQWIQESARRFQEFKAGHITAKSSSDVFKNVRAKLDQVR